MSVQRLIRKGKGMAVQSVSSASCFQQKNDQESFQVSPFPILKREKNGSRLFSAELRTDSNRSYSLTEAAYLTRLPRATWINLTQPTTRKKTIRVPSIFDGKERKIRGEDILSFVASIDHVPLETKNLEDVSRMLGRSHQSFLANDLIWNGEERYLTFRKYSDGKSILIPCYRWIDGVTLLIDSRDFEFISREISLKTDFITILDAKKLMLEKGVDLTSAELLNAFRAVEHEEECSFVRYVSPDKHEIRLRVFKHSMGTNGLKHVTRKSAVMELIRRILEYQRKFIVYNEALRQAGIQKPDNRVLSSNPHQFSYNGEVRSISIVAPSHISWIGLSDWNFFLACRRLSELIKTKVYAPVIKELCHAFSGELIRKNVEKFRKSISLIGLDKSGFNELAIPLSLEYGLWLRVYEVNGTWAVNKSQLHIARFARNVNSHDGRARARSLNEFESEFLAAESFDLDMAIKMWIVRDVLMKDWSEEPKRARNSELHFDRILEYNKTSELFREFPLEKIELLLRSKTSDLRYVPAVYSDISEALSSTNDYSPDLFALK